MRCLEAKATAATKERKEEGHIGFSDEGERLPKGQRVDELVQDMQQDGTAQDEAEQKAAEIVDRGIKYEIVELTLSHPRSFPLNR